MYIPSTKAPLFLMASIARHPSSMLAAPSTKLMMSTSAAAQPQPAVFPFWLRLKGMAQFEDRQRVTSEVADSISSSGGFLSRANILSDMVTVMTMEDVEPDRIGRFQQRMGDVEGFRLDDESTALLDSCQLLLREKEDIKIPPSVFANLQISWLNAPGNLRQEIVADG
ncbi:expressed unknown protein [Seminavis robusta]|uniref:Uncharacterized protein n=1 Tax=Seminavis robusta TaxID=568900 RepID=A0A9N8E227_9STRA|nr:expressed unknown protein [Seminavis robusta]|eukprot:Sro479_g151210.1 n/a (168) ;mRNA; f:27943-28446